MKTVERTAIQAYLDRLLQQVCMNDQYMQLITHIQIPKLALAGHNKYVSLVMAHSVSHILLAAIRRG